MVSGSPSYFYLKSTQRSRSLLCVYPYVCECMCVHLCVCMCVHVSAHVCMCVSTRVGTHVYVCLRGCACVST